eukprot:1304870-Alexandrium_andersonii.AAC.1
MTGGFLTQAVRNASRGARRTPVRTAGARARPGTTFPGVARPSTTCAGSQRPPQAGRAASA